MYKEIRNMSYSENKNQNRSWQKIGVPYFKKNKK